MPVEIIEPELSRAIVRAFFDVYNELGYGLLESLYARALEIVLTDRGYRVEREVTIVVPFQGKILGKQRVDMLVEGRVVVETKATEHLPHASRLQLRSYVTASRRRLGILLHFGPRPVFFREVGARDRTAGG